MLTHRVPYPPDRGDRIRSYHVLKYLSKRARVSLASVTQEPTPAEHLAELNQLCEQVAVELTTLVGRVSRDAWSLARGRSATEGHFWLPRLAKQINRWQETEPFDAVVCFCSGMYRYTQLPALREIMPVVDLVDVDSQKWADCAASSRGPIGWLQRLESRRVNLLEQEICDNAESVILISHAEREVLRRTVPNATAMVAGNGVDTDYFSPSDAQHNDQPNENAPTCCFVGVLNYQPNVDGLSWFIENVWPLIMRRCPQARFRMVGRSPSSRVNALAEAPGVELHANVLDVRPYLANCAAVVAPLRIARGVQNKVLEAMAMARPTVVSPQALTGISALPGQEVLLAESAEDWGSLLTRLFSDGEHRRQIGAAARRYALEHHSWDETLAPFGNALGLTKPAARHPEALNA